MRIKYLAAPALLLAPLCATSTSVLAIEFEDVVVTPNRYPTKLENSFQPVSVIDRSDIEREQPRSTEDLLRNIVGLDVAISGGRGQQTEIHLRGNSTARVLVLVDGIRIGSATSGGASLQSIPPEIIERVEVIRGPRSSLYGADAMGGVIQIFTRRNQGPAKGSIEAGAGNHNTNKQSLALTGGNATTSAGFVAAHHRTQGVNASREESGQYTYNPDADGFSNTTAALNVHHRIGAKIDTFFTALNASGTSGFDAGDMPDANTDYTQSVFSLGLSSELSKQASLNAVLGESHDDTYNFSYASEYNTRKRNLNLNGVYSFSDGNDLVAGVETLEDYVDSNAGYVEDSRTSTGLYLQQSLDFGRHSVLLGGRNEHIEGFGDHATGNAGYSFDVSKDSKLTLSYGEGFRAPSFNDLYYPGYANPDLKPEESYTSELDYIVCFQQGFGNVSLFHSRYQELIVLDDNYVPQNVGQADIKGIELEGAAEWNEWSFEGNVTLLRPLNLDYRDDLDLRRTARKTANLTVDYRWQRWSFGATVNARGQRYDDTLNLNQVGGYSTANLHAEWNVNKNLDLKFAVYNAGDKDYRTTRGYHAADREFMTSVKVNF